jgi:hypothetical protein
MGPGQADVRRDMHQLPSAIGQPNELLNFVTFPAVDIIPIVCLVIEDTASDFDEGHLQNITINPGIVLMNALT